MLTEDQLNALAAKHGGRRGRGGIEYVVYNGVDLVFRKPTRAEATTAAVGLESENAVEKAMVTEQLAQLLIVHVAGKEGPTCKDAWQELLDDYPFACRGKEIARALARLNGSVQADTAKSSGDSSQPKASPPTTTQGG